MKQRLVFIVNPISGTRQRLKKQLPQAIERYLDHEQFDYSLHYTEYPGHAHDIAQDVVRMQSADIIAVAGGDGSVNEVVQVILHSDIKLGILPFGSGNGLARHLGFPMQIKKMIEILNRHVVRNMDVVKVGDEVAVSNVGMGFDGYVSTLFERLDTRGFWGYAIGVLKGAWRYPGFPYRLRYNGSELSGKAFMLTAFNSNQHGYNMKMAPQASLNDGKLDVYVLADFPRWKLPLIVAQVLLNQHHRSRYFTYVKAREVRLQTEEPAHLHIDGEPAGKVQSLHIEVLYKAIKVIAAHGKI